MLDLLVFCRHIVTFEDKVVLLGQKVYFKVST